MHGNNNDVVPALFNALFPSWFVGFAFAAIAIGALVPAAVMSIGAANLFTRNFWKAYVQRGHHAGAGGEGRQAGVAGGQGRRAGVILLLPTKFALDLQLLGGVWILQTFPARGVRPVLRSGCARRRCWPAGLAGIVSGTWTAFADGVKPVHTFDLGGDKFTVYTGLLALVLNVVVAIVVQAVLRTPAPAAATLAARRA